jgi:zinc protease
MIRAGLLSVALLVLGIAPAAAVDVQRVVSPGGIEAWLVEDRTNPVIALELAFRGGSSLDPPGKEGLANFVAGTIDEGSGPLDSQSFQKELNDLSISLRFNAGSDEFFGSLQTLTENKDRAFELLHFALTEPRFDDEPLGRIRGQILAGIAATREDPDTIVGRALWKELVGEHPYARRHEGTEESLMAIEKADLSRFVTERFARDNLFVGVVGDIDAEELATRLDEMFGDLPARAVPDTTPEASVNGGGATVLIEMDIPQSVVSFGQTGIKRDDPDYYAAYVVNHILGGGSFSSRLYQEVREKRGLAYSVYSFLNPRQHVGLIRGRVSTRNERVAESLDLIRGEWERMAEDGPTQEELERAKTFLTGSFPLRLSSSGAIAGMLVGIQLEDLGIDYLDRRNGLIEAITLEDVRRVSRRLLDPEALTVVVVGSPDDIEASETRSPDG